jgi:AcrR family transcriptional regulator
MSAKPAAKAVRRRRTAEVARTETLAEARHLLLTDGPQAVTLKGVAAPLGMSHVNLIHHFGSAEGLHAALMESMVAELRNALNNRDYEIRDMASARRFIDLVFDAFNEGGAGKLTAWIALSQNSLVMDRLVSIVAEVAREMEDSGLPRDVNAASFVTVVSLALADSLAGGVLSTALDLPADNNRDLAARLMLNILGRK